ncbi:MAG: sel1 repeat family protein, partial [Opitutaceae bacterium]|nr:sel1 repeat family protein [Opitutaceae bacterium]
YPDAIAVFRPAGLSAADGPGAAAEADDVDDPSEAEPVRVPPGERPFWEAVLLLSTDDAEKQKRGRDRLLEAGDLEYVPAQTYLGECYLRGQDGFARSERKAAAWFRLAADRGDATAQIYLGTCNLLGKGVPKDRAKAKAVLVQAAAASGDYKPPEPPAWFMEERAKDREAGTRDESEAGRDGPIAMAPTAAPWELLLGRGHFMLGLIQEEERDFAAALASFEKAAAWGTGGRAGIADAAARAARCHALGRGCTRDLSRANELLERSRDLRRSGDMAALHSMWTNRRVDDFLLAELEKQSSAEADAHLTEDQQDVAAALQKENPAEALRWCEMSANAGEVWAMIELAEILRTGRAGSPDTAGAFAWYLKARETGKSWVALANLAACYQRGIGTAVDEAAAREIIDRHADDNFAVALAAAGHVPPGSWTAAGWWAFLDTQARVARLPIARYHAAVRDFQRLAAAGGTKIDVKQKDVLKAMRRAAEEGFGGAHYYLAGAMRLGWDTSGTQEKYEAELKKGADLGDLHAMVDYAVVVAAREGNANLRRAIELNLEVIRRDPDNANAHNNLAIDMQTLAAKGISMDGIRDVDGEAIRHLERAEELGSAVAAKNLAIRYVKGEGVSRDVRMAYTYYQSAAEKGDTESNRILGRMHEKGEGVPVTPREAMYYYRIAALDGDVEALKAVCDFYLQGRGVERDLEAAKVWLARLAGTGNVVGFITFGDVLLRQKQYAEALKFWKSMLEIYHPMIQGAANDRLALIYREGLGVKANPRRADKYNRAALELRNPDALCRQGRDLIVAGKSAEAVPILERAGDTTGEALFLLGSIRVAGQGVPKDVATGLRNFHQAAQLGHANAKYMLAVATLKNLPGAPTLDEAARLLEEAEAGGFAKAAELRATVESKRAKAAGAPSDAGRAGSG